MWDQSIGYVDIPWWVGGTDEGSPFKDGIRFLKDECMKVPTMRRISTSVLLVVFLG